MSIHHGASAESETVIIAAANLREEPHAQPCPCAWCRLERDNQGETMSELTRAVMTADPAVIA